MRSATAIAGLFTAAMATVSARAQLPAHATLLNPTTVFAEAIVLQDGDTVHAFGRGSTSVLRARSRDGGRTWPVLEAPLGAYGAGQGFTAAVASPGVVLVLANDQSLGPVCWRSADDGTTWSPAVPLASVAGPQSAGQVALLADGLDVVAVWTRTVPGEVRSRRSVDGGATWLPEQLLHTAGASTALSCHRNGSVLDVIWSWNSTVVHQRSIDGGATWLPTPHTVAGPGLQVASSDGTNLLAWLTSGTYWHSTNGGASWTPRSIPGLGYAWSTAQEGSRIVVAGVVTYTLVNPTYVICVSSDGGLTWSPSLQLPSPIWLGGEARVAMGVAYVAFPGLQLGVVTSRDGGATWQLVGGPANSVSAGPRRNVHLATSGIPNAGFYVYVGLGSSLLGSATPGAGAIAPRLVADGLPFQGATTTLQVLDAVGGSLGVLAVSIAPPSPLPFANGTVWPTVAPVLFAFATGGTPSTPGTGGFALPIAVPVNAALVGLSLTSQAAVLDGAGAGGFALSNALETWLR